MAPDPTRRPTLRTRSSLREGSRRAQRRARRFWVRHWSALLVGVLALTVAVAAVRQSGMRTSDNHLDDALVQVANTSQGLVGSLNTQIDDMSASASVGRVGSYRLRQDGDTTLVRLDNSNELETYDSSRTTIDRRLALPTHSDWSYGGGTLAVWDTDSGTVWFGPLDQMMQVDFGQARAQMHLSPHGTAVVTSSGSVVGLDTTHGSIVRVVAGKETSTPLTGVTVKDADLQLSAVGDQLVVLNTTASTVWREGWSGVRDVQGGDQGRLLPPVARLAADADVVLATRAGLIGVTRGGSVRNLGSRQDADPITPAQVGSCLYGVNNTVLTTACRGQASTAQQVPEVHDAGSLQLQTNRDHVVLNEQSSGVMWLVQKGLRRLSDWKHVQPVVQTSALRPNDTTQTDTSQHTENNKPVVHDQAFFARVGQDTVLPVLDGCTDADGDILTVTDASIGGGATASITSSSNGVQVGLPAKLPATYHLTFTVSDGKFLVSGRATITAEAADIDKADHAPVLHRDTQKLVTSRTDATWHLLNDWRDPDGDALQVLGARVEGESGDSVTWSPDGTVSFHDVGKVVGQQVVVVQVGDGVRSTQSRLRVKVSSTPAPPLANGDYVRAQVGVATTISPLANDEGSPSLQSVMAEDRSVQLVRRAGEPTFSFKAPSKGTYYLRYVAASPDGATSTGIIRVDVDAASQGQDRPLVAGRDVVLLPAAPAKTLLDPLLNDTGDDNQLLVVLEVDSNDAVRTVLSDRHLISFSWRTMPKQPVTLGYRISDGRSIQVGTIEVVPVPRVPSAAPVTVPDTLKVRAGQIGMADVLANDTSPLGLDLSLDPTLPENPNGMAWVQGDMVRVSVPPDTRAGSYTIEYNARDSQGSSDVGFLTVSVISRDAPNEAPLPESVDARVTSGSTTRIPIPLNGIDPDGDAVQLVGIASSPRLGWVSRVGNGWLEYHAMPDSPTTTGTDSFSYRVVDSGGAAATGTVRVGVVAPYSQNNPPVAVSDDVTVAPGRPVRLDLLSKDYDPDGDPIHLVSGTVQIPGITPIISDVDSSVQFTAPTMPTGSRPIIGQYQFADNQNATTTGSFSITVSTDAKPVPPVANDDVASLADVERAGKGGWVRVDVRRNDTDADGTPDQLTVRLPQADPEVAAVDTDQFVRVRVGSASQQVRYTIMDADGQTAEAVLTVPGTDDDVPHLMHDPMTPLRAVTGQPLHIDLNSYVVGTQGRKVIATSSVDAGAVGGSIVPDRSPTTITFQSDDNYAGPAAVAVEVSDDITSAQRPDAWVTLPITVVPPPAQGGSGHKQALQKVGRPPQGADPLIQVGAGEPAQTVDLTTRFTDPQGEDIYFDKWQAQGSTPAGLTATFQPNDPSKWQVQASDKAVPGSRITYRGSVSDASNESRVVNVTFVVTRSTRPLPTAVPDQADGKAGVAQSVDVTANDRSNLLDDQSVHLVGAAQVTSGEGSVSQDPGKGTVTVTPLASFAGRMTVQYTIVDATNDPSRQVNGILTVTVVGRPGAPGIPVQQSVGDGTFTVQFTPAAANGSPVTAYKYVAAPARAGGGSVSGTCPANACTVTGVTNGVPYTVTVQGVNAQGAGPSSGASAPITPDVKPEAPTISGIDFGPEQLTVHWTPAVTKGSAVDQYQVKLLTTGDTKTATATATGLTWTGLTDGTKYQFVVQAHNKAGWSDFSSPAAEHPTRQPDAPTDVTADDVTTSRDGNWIDIQWSPPADTHGDPITCYQVSASDGTVIASCPSQAAPTTGRQGVRWKQAKNGQPYVFTVRAFNRLNKPGDPAQSSATHSFGAPDAPTDATLTAQDGCVTISDVKAVTHGEDVDTYSVQTNPASANGSVDKFHSGDQLCGLTNGRTYTVMVRAWAKGKASDYGSVGTVKPVGPLGAPSVSVGAATKDGGRVLTVARYTDDNANGNDPSAITWQYKVDDGDWTTASLDDQSTFTVVPDAGKGESAVQVRAIPKGGAPSQPTTLRVTAPLVGTVDKASAKVTVQLSGWPDGQAKCTLSPGGSSIPVDVKNGAGNGSFDQPLVNTGNTPPPGPTSGQVDCQDGDLENKVGVSWTP